MKIHPEDMDHVLKFDPLAAAEQITGQSYKNDSATGALGMALHFDHVQRKRELLAAARDTHYGQTYDQYRATLEANGFDFVQERPFEYSLHREEPVTLHNVVAIHPEGIAVIFDTYTWGDRVETVNGGKAYYNWQPNARYWDMYDDPDAPMPPHVTSSGHWTNMNPEVPDRIPNPDYDDSLPWDERPDATLPNPYFNKRTQWVYVGDHDCREGLIHNLNQLREWGSFIRPWVEMPFGVNTFDLDESRAFYDERMWPRSGTPEYDRWIQEPMGERQYERLDHYAVAMVMEAEDQARWPQELRELVGDAAIIAQDQKEVSYLSRETQRINRLCENR